MYSWEEMRAEIVERLESPTKEQIARFIEKAYKLGYEKGINVGVDCLNWLKRQIIKGIEDIDGGDE